MYIYLALATTLLATGLVCDANGQCCTSICNPSCHSGTSRLSLVTIRQFGTTVETSQLVEGSPGSHANTPTRLILDVDCDLDELIERYNLVLTIGGISTTHHLDGRGGFVNRDYAETDALFEVQYTLTFKDVTRLGNHVGKATGSLQNIGTAAKLNVFALDTPFVIDWAQVGRDPLVGKLSQNGGQSLTHVLKEGSDLQTVFFFYSDRAVGDAVFTISGSLYGFASRTLYKGTLADLKDVSILSPRWHPAQCRYSLESVK